jgi:hypothetical protein
MNWPVAQLMRKNAGPKVLISELTLKAVGDAFKE